MSLLKLIFNYRVNLDSCLDAIFGLEQITALCLIWNRISLDKIKSLMKQGGMKRWEIVFLGPVEQEVNDSDILEICSYLPSLREWTLFVTRRATLTVDGAREWKRICPNLEIVHFIGGEFPEEVKVVLQGLGVNVR
jgi:hypothetical protein